MSQENVESVRRGFGSAEAFWALLDEYVVMDLRGAADRFPDFRVCTSGAMRLSRSLGTGGALGPTTASMQRS